MKKTLLILSIVLVFTISTNAQESGNRVYGQQRRRPIQSTGVLSAIDGRGNPIVFIEANVLLNAKADAYVAVLGVAQEGVTAQASNARVNDLISDFTKSLDGLGVKRNDIFVDFITQNRVYDYTVTGNTVTEKLTGFETKKTVAVRYKDRSQLEQIINAATKASIFDLIKVDYVVSDFTEARKKLFEEATRVIKQKEETYTKSFGVKFVPTVVASEKYDSFFPGELYNAYQAYESGTTYGNYDNRVIQKRKSGTFYYEPLDASDFDSVLNSIGIEPIVQFTLYLKVQYSLPDEGIKK